MSHRKSARAEQLPRPKAGPGQVFKRELIGEGKGHARRFRNVAVTPLQHAWHRGTLETPPESRSRVTADDRLSAGETFERLWYTLHRTGFYDSTQGRLGGGGGVALTDAQADANRRVEEIARRMEGTNHLIALGFIVRQLDVADALRYAGVDVHPDGRAYRLREALDDLIFALSGWREARASKAA